MKPFTRITISVLSSLLVLLGFGACKTTKKLPNPNKKNVTIIRDTIRVIQQIEPQRDPRVQKVVYGPAPAMYRDNIK